MKKYSIVLVLIIIIVMSSFSYYKSVIKNEIGEVLEEEHPIVLKYIDSYVNFLIESKLWNGIEKTVFVINIVDYNDSIKKFSISFILMDYELETVNAKYYWTFKNNIILFRYYKKACSDYKIQEAIEITDENVFLISKHLNSSAYCVATYEPIYFIVNCSNNDCNVDTTYNPRKEYEIQDFFIDSSQLIFHNNLNKHQFDSILHEKNN